MRPFRIVLAFAPILLLAVSCGGGAAEPPPGGAVDAPPATVDVSSPAADIAATDLAAIAEVAEDAESADSSPAEQMTFVGCDGPVDLEAVASRHFVVAPYLILPRPDSVTLRWEALDDDPSYLLWGPAGHIDHCVCVTDPTRFEVMSDDIDEGHDGWIYSLTLEGLEPGARHDYTLAGAEMIDDRAMDLLVGERTWVPFPGGSFATPPPAGGEFSVVIYGDNQPFTFEHELVVQAMVDRAPDVVLHTGDIVHNGSFEQYRGLYFPMAAPLLRTVPHIHAAGNHEQQGEAIPFDAYFPIAARPLSAPEGELPSPGPRTGWFDVGAARFFVLDSERSLNAGSTQLAWLDAALATTVAEQPEIRWLFAVWHRPTFTGSDSQWNGPREAIQEVLVRWRVDAVWNGHAHSYERFLQDGVHYIVTGGGGAGLNSIEVGPLDEDEHRLAGEESHHFVYGVVGAEQAEFRAIRVPDGGEIDRFTIEAKDRSALRAAR